MKKAIILLFTLLLCTTFVFVGCGTTDPNAEPPSTEEELPKKTDGTKAIVFVPGILGSQIYNCETKKNLWDPASGDIDGDLSDIDSMISSLISNNFAEAINLLGEIIMQEEDNILAQLLCDEDGNMLLDTTVAYPDTDDRHKYGAINSYKPLVDTLTAAYGDQYEVKLFNYNWIEDIRKSATHLEEFINSNNYTEVILISHSMGGLVSAQYLAKRENRARIDGYISICAPYYGANMAVGVIENPDAYRGYVQYVANLFKNSKIKIKGKSIEDNLNEVYDNYIYPLLSNTTALAQLLPSAELCAIDDNSLIDNGTKITTAEQLTAFYESRPWAKKSDGTLRKFIAEFNDYRNSFYVTKKGEKIFATDLVDSYYIGGTNQKTEYSTEFIQGEDNIYSADYNGDQTVLALSATLGRQPDNEHVFFIPETHAMANTFDGECKTLVQELIDKLAE